jgi:type IV pilus assembly protein PilV
MNGHTVHDHPICQDSLNSLRQASRRRHTQSGIGIIEVLVALVIVSLGVLGMAGLQLTGMKHSTNGFNRSKALMLTENLATRMRINRTGVLNGDYVGTRDGTACGTKPAPYCQAYELTDAESCSVQELAEFDLFSVACGDWGTAGANAGVAGMLPAGAQLDVICNGAVCGPASTYTLSVSWSENVNASSEEDPVIRRIQMRLRP